MRRGTATVPAHLSQQLKQLSESLSTLKGTKSNYWVATGGWYGDFCFRVLVSKLNGGVCWVQSL